jgi:hypothetical protein
MTSFLSFAAIRRQPPSTPRWCRRTSAGCSRSTAAGVPVPLCPAAREETLLAEAMASGITIKIKRDVFIAKSLDQTETESSFRCWNSKFKREIGNRKGLSVCCYA